MDDTNNTTPPPEFGDSYKMILQKRLDNIKKCIANSEVNLRNLDKVRNNLDAKISKSQADWARRSYNEILSPIKTMHSNGVSSLNLLYYVSESNEELIENCKALYLNYKREADLSASHLSIINKLLAREDAWKEEQRIKIKKQVIIDFIQKDLKDSPELQQKAKDKWIKK